MSNLPAYLRHLANGAMQFSSAGLHEVADCYEALEARVKVLSVENMALREALDAEELERMTAQEPVAVPEGCRLVPVEPTQKMVDAHINGVASGGFQRGYRAMLAAAPTP